MGRCSYAPMKFKKNALLGARYYRLSAKQHRTGTMNYNIMFLSKLWMTSAAISSRSRTWAYSSKMHF